MLTTNRIKAMAAGLVMAAGYPELHKKERFQFDKPKPLG